MREIQFLSCAASDWSFIGEDRDVGHETGRELRRHWDPKKEL